MTILEFYERFSKEYRAGNYLALNMLLREDIILFSTNVAIFDTTEAFGSAAIAERSQIAYIRATDSWYISATDPITIINSEDNLFCKLLALKAILSGDIACLDKIALNSLFAKDEAIVSKLLTIDNIKTLLPQAIMNGSIDLVHFLLKQYLRKTGVAFNLDEPLMDGLTALDLLSQSNNSPQTAFTKRMMLFYAAAWDYFVGEAPTVENMDRLPNFFSLAQPVANIERFISLQIVKKDKDNPFFDKKGLCVGLSCLYDWYAHQGKIDYYFMSIALLNIWDGSVEQLNKPLPTILPQALFYKTLGEFFQQWSNDILLFQGENIDTLLLKPEIKSLIGEVKYFQLQGALARYFHLVRPKAEMDTRLVVIESQKKFTNRLDLTQEQFEECLNYFIKIPHAYIQVGKNKHQTSIRSLMDQEQFDHFDSNRNFIPRCLESMDVLKESIIRSHPKDEDSKEYQNLLVYRYDGPMHKKPWAESGIFSAEEFPKTAVAAQWFQENSSNRFTHLHVAVLVQDTETIRKMLAEGKVDVLVKDAHGRCALDIAIENAYWEGTELLLADPRVQKWHLAQGRMEMLILYEREDFILKLFQHENAQYSISTILKLSLHYNGTKIIQDIKEAFLQDMQGMQPLLLIIVNIFFNMDKEDLAKELFVFMTQNLSAEGVDDVLNGVRFNPGCGEEQATLLHRAILEQNYGFAQCLIKKGADLNVPIEGGLYTGMTARQLLESRGKLALIPEQDRSLEQSIQVKFEKGFSSFFRMAKRMDDRLQEKINTVSTAIRF